MENVYSNAYLTLSAAAAKGCTEGFFVRCLVPYHLIHRKAPNEYVKQGLLAMAIDKSEPPVRNFTNEPVNLSGWTLQESLLSPRIIYLAPQRVIWQCDSMSKEDGYENKKSWEQIVSDYTARNLTCPADKLPAIAGVSRRY
jgi:hypothetical protein